MWLADEWGMEAAALKVSPTLPADGKALALASLPALSGKTAEYAARYWASAKDKFGEPNNPKVWLKGYRTPMSDRPSLELELGKTDYWTARAIELAFEEGGLRREYESRKLDIYRDLPGMIGTHSVVVTVDGCLILAQRKGGEVDFAGGTYSPSFEEQWNPLCDRTPHDAVLRGLREEFNVDRDHDVYVTVDNLKLVALAREWGRFWHTVILYVVHLPATAAKVLECWNAVPPPKDKNEHVAVVAVPLFESRAREFLENLLDRATGISRPSLERICAGNRIAGSPSDGEVHPTSGRARILIALFALGAVSTV